MRRRDLIALIGGTAIAWPLSARAQQTLPVVGYLSASSPETSAPFLDFFRNDLKESGYVEGRNVAIEVRWADGNYERLPALAAELVALKVAIIVAIGGPAARAARQATLQIPIVFQTGADPVGLGLVASLGRPGGNATGLSLYSVELAPKRLELLHEMMPNVKTVAVLHNPAAPGANPQLASVQSSARGIGVALQVLEARSTDDIEQAFARLAEQRPQALIVASDVLFSARHVQIVTLAARHALPAIYGHSSFVAAGGLVSYGPDVRAAVRPLGAYTGKILGGARPADLPVQQPTRFELVINLRTAKALGLAIPPAILARADEVIE